MIVNVGIRHYQEVNAEVREILERLDSVNLQEVYGQRYIGGGMSAGKKIIIEGTPGNDLGIYLAGGEIEVKGNGQDAVGNTMSGGRIVIHGSVGDAMGYSMRDGYIFVKENCGYRGGIHMKEYKSQHPVIVLGGSTGAYLGEYMAGGVILVLNLNGAERPTEDYLATGMHGGKIYIRGDFDRAVMSKNIKAEECSPEDINEIRELVSEYTRLFGGDCDIILSERFTKITPVSNRPFKDVYTSK